MFSRHLPSPNTLSWSYAWTFPFTKKFSSDWEWGNEGHKFRCPEETLVEQDQELRFCLTSRYLRLELNLQSILLIRGDSKRNWPGEEDVTDYPGGVFRGFRRKSKDRGFELRPEPRVSRLASTTTPTVAPYLLSVPFHPIEFGLFGL